MFPSRFCGGRSAISSRLRTDARRYASTSAFLTKRPPSSTAPQLGKAMLVRVQLPALWRGSASYRAKSSAGDPNNRVRVPKSARQAPARVRNVQAWRYRSCDSLPIRR